jgi:PTH1 family peptidyl-tRNA hydrolase
VAGNTPIQLIVGLGNPGDKYTVTRHNAGFWFIDQLARRHQTSFRTETKFKAEVASFEHEGKRVWLVKPTTFMNLSGECVGPFAKYYQIAPENTLVVHDELDLSVGTSRYKWAGGHGGHNGIRDIFNHFGKDFWRLRVGVGHPGSKEQVLSFVMKAPSSKEQSLIDDSLERVFDTLPDVLTGDMEAAMRSLHKKPDE